MVSCYHIGIEEGTSRQESASKRRMRRRRERQREHRRQGFTKYDGMSSPVLHILRYVQECCRDHPNLGKLHRNFGKSLGPVPKAWYQTPAVQAAKDWAQLQDLFLMRFAAQRRSQSYREMIGWEQHFGEKTACYINKWRNAAWSDPESLKVPEKETLRS